MPPSIVMRALPLMTEYRLFTVVLPVSCLAPAGSRIRCRPMVGSTSLAISTVFASVPGPSASRAGMR